MKPLCRVAPPIVLAVALALVACGKSSDPSVGGPGDPAAKEGVAAASGAATTALPSGPVFIADADLSTPADHEEAVEKAINAENYKSELAALEANFNKE